MINPRKIDKFGVATLFPDATPKPIISFHERFAVHVILPNDFLTFTPKFGDFKEFDDVFDFLRKYVEDKELEKLDVELQRLSTCIFEINPKTLEMGEFIEDSGSGIESYVWNNLTKKFDEVYEDDF